MPLDVQALPASVLALAFLAAAAAVWTAGTRLSGYAAALADRLGLSGAATGMLILGVITSTPEIATSGSAAWRGDPHLAAGDLLGSVSVQATMLAIVDFFIGKRALTSTLPSPALLMQANMSVILLALATAGVAVGDVGLFGIGLWPVLLAAVYCATPFLARAAEAREVAAPRTERREKEEQVDGGSVQRTGVGALALRVALAGCVILVAGVVLANAGQALAQRTGLGSSFFGTVFLASVTSLPELSSAIAAARLNRADLAVGDVLGSNMANVAMFLYVDAVYRGPPLLNELGEFSIVSALLGAVLTLIFMIGLIERGNRSLFRMGYDSIAVLAVYGVGLAALYHLR